MIQEQYISFETAKLLKEKGFNEGCPTTYTSNGLFHTHNYRPLGSDIFAPTQSFAMRWLREVHNLFIQICIIPHTTITIEQKYYFFIIHKDRRTLAFKKDFPSEYYFTYEEACEEAVRYCLENLI